MSRWSGRLALGAALGIWLSACQHSPELKPASGPDTVSLPVDAPDWLSQPPDDTPRYFYATAVKADRTQALEHALARIARNVAVTVTSRFESHQEVWRGAFDWQRHHSQQTLTLDTPPLTVTGHKVRATQRLADGRLALLLAVDREQWYQSLSAEHERKRQVWLQSVRATDRIHSRDDWLRQVWIRLSLQADWSHWWQTARWLQAIDPTHDLAADRAQLEGWREATQTLLTQRSVSIFSSSTLCGTTGGRTALEQAFSQLGLTSVWPPFQAEGAGLTIQTSLNRRQAHGFEILTCQMQLDWRTAEQTLATWSFQRQGRGLVGQDQALPALQQALKTALTQAPPLSPLWSASFED
ncbi:hypothetical protein [Thiomicrospira sp. WB1]|uniref:hypothetical protein n=1 Tax=Thiomicrospira sp. WB1 TaxID=1685380 RepID=UPI00128F0B9C|nr:hypothetical protein [Thiomicrospira sp. WB1]